MKTYLLLFFYFIASTSCLGQDVLLNQYQQNGDNQYAFIGRCGIAQEITLAQVVVSEEIENDKISIIQFIPLQSYVTGFEINPASLQDNMKLLSDNRTITWKPNDLSNKSEVEILVTPKIDEQALDSISLGSCTQNIKIQLPIKKDLKPVVKITDTLRVELEFKGEPVIQKYDLYGGNDGISFKLFDDEDFETRKLTFSVNPATPLISIESNHILKFKFEGPWPDDSKFVSKLFKVYAKDQSGQISDPVHINFVAIPNYTDTNCNWLATTNNTIEWSEVLEEGKQYKINPFFAFHPTDLSPCDIVPISIDGAVLGPEYDFTDKVLYWTPPFNAVDDVFELKPVAKSYKFKASYKNNSESEITLKVTLKNGSKYKEQFEKEIKSKYDDAQSRFVDLSSQVLCYLQAAARQADNNENFLKEVNDAVASAENSFAISAAGPVAAGVYTSVGLLIKAFQNSNKQKSGELATIAKNFETSVAKFNDVSKAYTLQLALSKEHISAQDIIDLKPKIKAVEDGIKMFEKNNAGYRSIADIFWEKKSAKIRRACPESTPSKAI